MLMPGVALLLSTLVLLASGRPPQQPPRSASLESLAWMAGSWETTRGGACIEERWTRPASDTLIGMSRTVVGGQTRSFEFMRIESRSDGVFFVAKPGGRPPVDFRMASNSGAEIVFLNPGHADHLKRITYRRSGVNELTARIEGEDGGKPFAIDYVYRASTTAGCP
jgi:Domain of unknown function (DUF6265)